MTVNLRDHLQPAEHVRAALGLAPHPEGGHYREMWRDRPVTGERGAGTSILFLLSEGEVSKWHRVDAAEIWLWCAGAPLLLRISSGADANQESMRLGPDYANGEVIQGVVSAQAWQDARSLGKWSLVSCVVAPAFEFSGFEIAPDGWSPSQA